MKTVLISHIGNSRQNQEDNAVICKHYLDAEHVASLSQTRTAHCDVFEFNKKNNLILAVSDGMGGHSFGEIASFLTVKHISDNFDRIVSADKSSLSAEIVELNRKVWEVSREDPKYKGMGATLCGVVVNEDSLIGFNIGDSRLYRYENGTLTLLTKDHSEGQRLLELGLLTEEEIKTFPNRKAICKYIGMKTDPVADVFDIDNCKSGALLLLCTDGLTDALSNSEIRDILDKKAPLRNKGEELLNTALRRNIGHGDNITIILIEF